MTGSAPAEGGKSKQRYPWQLIVAALAWAALGVTALVEALSNTGSSSEADSGSVSQVQGNLGSSAAAVGENGGSMAALLILIGIAALMLTALLLLGQSWTRLALQVLGVVAVIYFAATVGWMPTLIAMASMVVGSVMLLTAKVSTYLSAN
ncbi:MAG TPA: hypothetical protein VIQ30_00955 [Pseudonocardia sp.]